MDKRLEAAFDLVKYQQTLRNQRDLLEDWVFNKLQYACSGGLFKITPELISMVKTFIDAERTQAILLDCNNVPVEIVDLETFLNEIIGIYFEATNEYYVEYQKMRQAKTIQSLVECPKEY